MTKVFLDLFTVKKIILLVISCTCVFAREMTETERKLIYAYDINHDRPLYCYLGTLEEIKDVNRKTDIVKKCIDQNKNVKVRLKGQVLYPYFGHGVGVKPECEPLKNVLQKNCTHDWDVYSECNYTCKRGMIPSHSYTKCIPVGFYNDTRLVWDNLCREPEIGTKNDTGLTLTHKIVIVIVVAFIVALTGIYLLYRKYKRKKSVSETEDFEFSGLQEVEVELHGNGNHPLTDGETVIGADNSDASRGTAGNTVQTGPTIEKEQPQIGVNGGDNSHGMIGTAVSTGQTDHSIERKPLLGTAECGFTDKTDSFSFRYPNDNNVSDGQSIDQKPQYDDKQLENFCDQFSKPLQDET